MLDLNDGCGIMIERTTQRVNMRSYMELITLGLGLGMMLGVIGWGTWKM